MKKIIFALCALVAVVSADINTASCGACHGAHFEKHALGKSKVVADMNATEIATALKGYKAGTYGGPMKGIMVGQAKSLDDKKIEDVATFISTKSNPKTQATAKANDALPADMMKKFKSKKNECLNELKAIESCVEKAANPGEMHLCKQKVFKLAEKASSHKK